MATKKDTSDAKVTRIRATDAKSSKAVKKVTPSKAAPKKQSPVKERRGFGILRAPIDYFVGAWRELRQVHWPTRRATWGLTMAVLLFSAFFVVLVLLLDALFKYLFQLVLG